MNDLESILTRIKETEQGITNSIIPIWSDSIKDNNRSGKRLFVVNMMLILVLAIVCITAMIIITKQNDKYIEFMEQFDIRDSVYQETNDNSSINDGIKIMK